MPCAFARSHRLASPQLMQIMLLTVERRDRHSAPASRADPLKETCNPQLTGYKSVYYFELPESNFIFKSISSQDTTLGPAGSQHPAGKRPIVSPPSQPPLSFSFPFTKSCVTQPSWNCAAHFLEFMDFLVGLVFFLLRRNFMLNINQYYCQIFYVRS